MRDKALPNVFFQVPGLVFQHKVLPRSFVKSAGSVLSGEALATKHKEQDVLFQSCLADDPHFTKQVRSLELMLRVRDRLSGFLVACFSWSQSLEQVFQ